MCKGTFLSWNRLSLIQFVILMFLNGGWESCHHAFKSTKQIKSDTHFGEAIHFYSSLCKIKNSLQQFYAPWQHSAHLHHGRKCLSLYRPIPSKRIVSSFKTTCVNNVAYLVLSQLSGTVGAYWQRYPNRNFGRTWSSNFRKKCTSSGSLFRFEIGGK